MTANTLGEMFSNLALEQQEQNMINELNKPKTTILVFSEQLEPLQDIVNEGYDCYDTTHHLVVQRWLKIIEEFLANIK